MIKISEKISHYTAIIGGIILALMIILIVVSILGRTAVTLFHSPFLQENMAVFANFILDMGVGPINGDYELVEAGMAIALFAFMPICQFQSGHATVDIITQQFPKKLQRILVLFWELIMALVIILIAWRQLLGAIDKYNYGEITPFLQIPLYYSFFIAAFFAIIAGFVALVCVLARVIEYKRNIDILAKGMGAD